MTFSGVGDFFSTIFDIIRTIKIVDVIDILLVSVILYYAYKFVRDRRAGKLAAGVILFIIALVISDVAGMHTIQYLFQNIFQVGVIALVILFQPELRSALEKVGGGSLR
ncbi:MAG: TIGR00159 family protein, partial [Candidatus Avispirillum sp.]